MPLYPYRCTSCGHRFERIQNFSAEPETVCPKCGKTTLERPLTAPRFNFKGAGWYVNDYAPKSSESSSESSESKPTESKETAKPSDAGSTPAAPSTPATPAPSSSSTSSAKTSSNDKS